MLAILGVLLDRSTPRNHTRLITECNPDLWSYDCLATVCASGVFVPLYSPGMMITIIVSICSPDCGGLDGPPQSNSTCCTQAFSGRKFYKVLKIMEIKTFEICERELMGGQIFKNMR